MPARRGISVTTLILIGVVLGIAFRNIRVGLVVGLCLGLLAGGLMSSRRR